MTAFLQGVVLADETIGELLHLAQLFCCNFLEVAEVEAQAVGCYQTTFLLHVRADDLAESVVQDMCGRVVTFDGAAAFTVNGGVNRTRYLFGQFAHYLYGQTVLALRINDAHCLAVGKSQRTRIAYLTAHLGVEWRAV